MLRVLRIVLCLCLGLGRGRVLGCGSVIGFALCVALVLGLVPGLVLGVVRPLGLLADFFVLPQLSRGPRCRGGSPPLVHHDHTHLEKRATPSPQTSLSCAKTIQPASAESGFCLFANAFPRGYSLHYT